MDSIMISDSVHCDLHSGNWGILNNQIVIYDFGWVLQKNISDFKRFFFLTHIHSHKAMYFFLEKYNIDLNSTPSIQKYVDEIVSNGCFDIQKGFKCIVNLFPNELKVDNFMFMVLSTCVFLSSLVNGNIEQEMDIQMKKQVEFIEKHECFQALGTILKMNSDENNSFQKRDKLQKFYENIYGKNASETIQLLNSHNKLT